MELNTSSFLKTSIVGKVNNLPSFKNEALLPVFEAVANSIEAIEDKIEISAGKITVEILRDSQMSFSQFEQDNEIIIGFKITDNGIGFDKDNYDSFLTSDTTHKLEKGCKGIGRFFWLKAFDSVEVVSVYSNGDEKRKRSFRFTEKMGIHNVEHQETEERQETSVSLVGFKEQYRKQPSAYKTTSKIAQRILEHCLSYYIDKKAPTILVKDSINKISLNDMFKEIEKNLTVEKFEHSGESFTISHIKLYSTYNKMHNLAFCANSRCVKTLNISNLLGTTAQFDEEDNKFVYSVYVSSPYLDKNVDSCRIEFNIPEKDSELRFQGLSLSMNQLKSIILEKSKDFLSEYLSAVRIRKQEIASNYVSEKNPTLRAVLHYCPEIYDEFEPNTSEERIDEILYKHKGRAEFEIRKKSKEILKTQASSVAEIKPVFDEIKDKIGNFQKDQLAGYILFRKMIIDLLDKKIELNKNGKYSNEDIVHDIVFPRRSSSHLLDYSEHNLWLIDEILTFHSFATSDNRLCDFSYSESEERPDIITFAEIDEDRTARSVSIVEFKKPQRKNFDEDPTRQLYRYVRKIKTNEIIMPNGRNLMTSETTRFYCYAVCDINKKIHEFAENNNYSKLKSEFGYYLYNRNLNAHTEIIAFDKIITDAKQRHKAFFEKLGL